MGLGFCTGYGWFWLLPLICMIVMLVIFVRMFRGGCMPMCSHTAVPAGEARETQRQVLDLRLARGELTREQYDALRLALQSSRE